MEDNQMPSSVQFDQKQISLSHATSRLMRNLLLIIGGLLLLGTAGIVGYELGVRKNVQSALNTIASPTTYPTIDSAPSLFGQEWAKSLEASAQRVPVKDSCFDESAAVDSSYHYQQYTVEKGDTLGSIALKQLEDGSRVNEILILNQNKYPTLLSNPEYLEKGWVFSLPPKDIMVQTASGLATIKGEVVYISEKTILVRVLPDIKQATFTYPDKGTKYIKNNQMVGLSDLKLQDCVNMTVETLANSKTNYPVIVNIN